MYLEVGYKMAIKEIFKNKWITVKSFSDKKRGIKEYYFSHDTRSGGKSVAILPFQKIIDGGIQFLLKGDIIPAWGEKIELCSITGAVEHPTPEATAIIELDEEVGYTVHEDELIPLGTCFGNKASDTINFLYTVDLTNKIPHEAKGDGDEKALGNESHWVGKLAEVKDPLVAILAWRVYKYLIENDIR